MNDSPRNGRQGFSLLEVLIALIIGSILALGVLSAQYQSLKLAQGSKTLWQNLNFSQEFLALRYPSSLSEPTPGRVTWQGTDGAAFELKLDQQPVDGVRWYSLNTYLSGSQMAWGWPVKSGGELVGNWPGKGTGASQSSQAAGGGSSGQSSGGSKMNSLSSGFSSSGSSGSAFSSSGSSGNGGN